MHDAAQDMGGAGAGGGPPDPELAALVEAFGRFFESFGLRRNVGRTWALLFVASEPLDQATIGEALGLSAGLVSTALAELVRFGAVRPGSRPGERRTFYEAEDRLLRIVANILTQRDLGAVRELRAAARRARAVCRPEGFTRRLHRRLRSVEALTELYEALAGLVVRAAGLPDEAVRGIARVVARLRPGGAPGAGGDEGA